MTKTISLTLWIIAVAVGVVAIIYQRDVATTTTAIAAAIGTCASAVQMISEVTKRNKNTAKTNRKDYGLLSISLAVLVIFAGVTFFALTFLVNSKIEDGKTHIGLRDYVKAVSDFQEADKWDRLPHAKAEILLGLAEAYTEQGKYGLALDKIAVYDQGLTGKDSNQDAQALDLKGRIQLAQGNSAIAVDFFKSALEKWDSGHANAKGTTFNGLARAYLLMGDANLAMIELLEAQKIFDNSGDKSGQALTTANMGMVNIFLGNIQLAEKQFHDAQSIYTQINSETGLALCNLYLGHLFWLNHEYANAEQYYKEALPIFTSGDILVEEVESYLGLGNASVGRGQYEVGKGYYNDALVLSQEIGYQHGVALANTGLGGYYAKTDFQDLALEHYQIALDIARTANNQKLIADIESNMGLLNLQMGVYSKADKLLSDAITIYKKLDQKEGLAIAYLNLALVRRNQQQNRDSLMLLKQAQTIFENLPESLRTMFLYRELGNLAAIMPNKSGSPEYYYDKAYQVAVSLEDQRGQALLDEDRCPVVSTSLQGVIECLDNAASLYRSINDIAGQAKISYQKGVVYLKNGDWRLAEKNFTDAKVIFEDRKMVRGHGQALAKLGEVALKEGDLDLAQINFDAANAIFSQSNFDHDIAVTNVNIATIWLYRNDFVRAEQLFIQAQTQLESDQDYTNNALTLNSLAFVEFSQAKYGVAISNYDKALQVAKSINNNELVAIVLTNSGRCSLALEDLTTAQSREEEALETVQSLPIPPPDLIAVIKTNLAEVYIHQEKYDEAGRLLDDALKIVIDKYPTRVERINSLLQEINNKR